MVVTNAVFVPHHYPTALGAYQAPILNQIGQENGPFYNGIGASYSLQANPILGQYVAQPIASPLLVQRSQNVVQPPPQQKPLPYVQQTQSQIYDVQDTESKISAMVAPSVIANAAPIVAHAAKVFSQSNSVITPKSVTTTTTTTTPIPNTFGGQNNGQYSPELIANLYDDGSYKGENYYQ